jgi:hypothetical protein
MGTYLARYHQRVRVSFLSLCLFLCVWGFWAGGRFFLFFLAGARLLH